ncbi:anaerobic sulfatase maturase [Yokenella regensburgei]|uniref:anaerobic sulfatase maturase n=2 Tax=Yokenella regensburgei TaxID=158877 RepID=UPI0012F8CB71|nr:anaerobic sulfatase maturase [Yokenella regensburgei]
MTGCQVMAKPASSRCNLRCRYCYYLDKPKYAQMDEATLDAFIRQHIAAQPGKDVQFSWQGGEPTLCGIAFFERVIELQKQHAGDKRIHNVFQTNGVALNDAWCRFFGENNWLVGISLDGPAELHDVFRRSRNGKPTQQRVMSAIEKLVAHRVEFNLLTVVNRHNSQEAERVYRYLRRQGTPFIQFIPLLELDEHGVPSEDSVSSRAWGEFLIKVFDIWVHEDIGRTFVQLFDSTLGVWSGFRSTQCALSETCGHAFALEANGDVFQCDHYVYPEHRLGNLHQTTLAELNASARAVAFGKHKRDTLSRACRDCQARRFCYGDCPKHRTADGKSALCAGYHRFFTYTAPYMRVMRDLIRQQRSPAELMTMLQKQS